MKLQKINLQKYQKKYEKCKKKQLKEKILQTVGGSFWTKCRLENANNNYVESMNFSKNFENFKDFKISY